MSLFQRAANNDPLTPSERALLKLVKQLIVATVLATLPVIAMYLYNAFMRNPGGMDWKAAGLFAVATFLSAFINVILKYINSHFDANNPVAQSVTAILEDADNYVRTWGGVANEPKIEPPLPSDVPDLAHLATA
jgi:Na+/H+-dicarboxylate symporter